LIVFWDLRPEPEPKSEHVGEPEGTDPANPNPDPTEGDGVFMDMGRRSQALRRARDRLSAFKWLI